MNENAESSTATVRRGRPPQSIEARAEYNAARGIAPLSFAGRPIREVKVGTLMAVPSKEFEGREKLDKKARTIAGVVARSINEAAEKSDAGIKHTREYLVAQVIRLLSDNIGL